MKETCVDAPGNYGHAHKHGGGWAKSSKNWSRLSKLHHECARQYQAVPNDEGGLSSRIQDSVEAMAT
jgi:hypothetical protein